MKIAVIGVGTMGSGIAQVCAKNHQVIMRDIQQEFIDKALAKIEKGLARNVEKGRMSEEDKTKIMGNLKGSTDINDIKDCDLIIEAATENPTIKKAIFKELDEVCKESCILASNTSSLSITEIAAATNRPDKVVGMHFFNPVPVMKLVEIIKGQLTSDETKDVIADLSKDIGKVPVEVEEGPGFVVNRILVPMINEAFFILNEKMASAEDIDNAMKLGANMPMGPLHLADLIGLDIVLAVIEVLHEEFGDSKYRPATLLKKLVRSGNLGMKTGRGVFDYTK